MIAEKPQVQRLLNLGIQDLSPSAPSNTAQIRGSAALRPSDLRSSDRVTREAPRERTLARPPPPREQSFSQSEPDINGMLVRPRAMARLTLFSVHFSH